MTGRRLAILVFVALASTYVAITGGHVSSPDAVVMGRVTESLVERGELAVADPGYPPGFLTPGRNGRTYAKYGLGQSLVGIPFDLAGRVLGDLAPEGAVTAFGGRTFLWYDASDPGEVWPFFGLALTNAFVVAATCSCLLLLGLELGYRPATAVAVALTAGLATPLLVYAKTFFSEPLAALGLVGFALGLARYRRHGRSAMAILAGAALALAILAKLAHVVLLPIAGVVAVLALPPSAGLSRRRDLALLGLGPATVLAGQAVTNAWRFGSPFATGYGAEAGRFDAPFLEGLLGQLVSPGRGLLIYLPICLAAAAWAPRLARRSPWLAVWSWGALLALLVLHSPWHGWDGGWCWGPRFLVPAMPFVALGIAPLFEGPRRGSLALLGAGLLAASALLSLTGTLVPFTEYHQFLRQSFGGAYLPIARWSWSAFPPLRYWQSPPSFFLLPRALATPPAWPLGALLGAAAAVAVGALVLLAGALRGRTGAVSR